MKWISKSRTWLASKFLAVVQYFEERAVTRLWNQAEEAVLSQFSQSEMPVAKIVIKNQREYLEQTSHHINMTIDRKTLACRQILILRIAAKAWKQLSALSAIVGVQPMSGPLGYVYRLAYQTTDDSRIQLTVLKNIVEAGTRKMQAKWALELQSNLAVFHEINVEDELVNALAGEIVNEVCQEILNDLMTIASHTDTISLAATPEKWVCDSHAQLGIKINSLCNEIAQATRRGAGNFAVMSPILVALLQQASKSVFVSAPKDANAPKYGPLTFVGTLNGTTKVYSSLLVGDDILIGYKGGSGETDAGYFYCPYVIAMPSGPVVDPLTFEPLMTLATRYGKFAGHEGDDSKSTAANYYAKLHVSDIQFC